MGVHHLQSRATRSEVPDRLERQAIPNSASSNVSSGSSSSMDNNMRMENGGVDII